MLIGITTAPRKNGSSYIRETIESLGEANRQKTHVFAEPDSPVQDIPRDCYVVRHKQKKGNWHNWLSMAKNMCRLAEDSQEKYILTAEDDVLFSPHALSRATVELDRLTRDEKDFGLLAVYTCGAYQKLGSGVFEISRKELYLTTRDQLWGACALAWNVDSLKKVAYCETATNWRGAGYSPLPDGDPETAHADICIGFCCVDLGLKMFFMNPSLAQHVGEVSSLREVGLDENRTAATTA